MGIPGPSTLVIEKIMDEQYAVGTLLHAAAAFRVRLWQLFKAIADG